MYRLHRWFNVRAGYGPTARQYLSDMTSYLTNHHNLTCNGFIEVFGPTTAACHLMIDFDNLTAFETWWNNLASDQNFGALQATEHTISIDRTTNQALLHSHTD